jgi:DNA-binding LytR/AlgR family response regulator
VEKLRAQLAQQIEARPQTPRWVRASKRTGVGEVTSQIAVADMRYFQADDKYTCVFARDGNTVRIRGHDREVPRSRQYAHLFRKM